MDQQALDIYKDLGHERGCATTRFNLGCLAMEQEEYDLAKAYLTRALTARQYLQPSGVDNLLQTTHSVHTQCTLTVYTHSVHTHTHTYSVHTHTHTHTHTHSHTHTHTHTPTYHNQL